MNRFNLGIGSVVLAFLLSANSFASEALGNMNYCLKNAVSTNAGVKCYDKATFEFNNELNITYTSLKTSLLKHSQSSLVKSLVTAENNWIAFRDLEKQFSKDYYLKLHQGTMYYTMNSSVNMTVVMERAIQLDIYLTTLSDSNSNYQLTESEELDIKLNGCLDNANDTQSQLKCVYDVSAEWEVMLNQEYKKLSSSLPKYVNDKLLLSQRAWLKFRDSDVSFSAGFIAFKDGTMYKITAAYNLMRLVRNRALHFLVLNNHLAN